MKIIKYLVLSLIISSLSYAQQSGWSAIYRPPDQSATVIDFVDSLHGWVKTFGGIRRTTDGGLTWSEPNRTVVCDNFNYINAKEGWIVGYDNLRAYIYSSADSGKTIKELYRKDYQWLEIGKGLTSKKFIAAGINNYNIPIPDTAVIVRTTDGGKSFSETAFLDSPLVYFRKLDFVDSLHGWIYGEYDSVRTSVYVTNGMFLITSDGGSSWKRINMREEPYRLKAFFFLDSLRGWAWGGLNSYVYKTTDGGIKWKLQWERPSFMDFDFLAMKFIDSLNGWGFGNGAIFGGIREVIFRTTDGGNSWTDESVDLSSGCYDAVMLSKTLGYVAADEAILKYGTVTEVNKPKSVPTGYILKDCYPNPFNSTTTIEYELPERAWVELKVFDILGKEIAILVNEEQSSGIYKKHFNATRLTSGIYLFKLITGNFQCSKQMMLIK